MDLWQQISPDLRTAIIDVLIVGVGVIGTWLASRITRIKERAKLQGVIDEQNVKHTDEMNALKASAERGRIDNETFIRDSAAKMSIRLDETLKELQKTRDDLLHTQLAFQAAREQFAHDSGVMEGKIQTLQTQNVDFVARLSQRDVQITDLNKQVVDLTKQVADLAALNGEKEKALTVATDKLTASDADNVRLRTEVARLETEVEKLKNDATLLKARVKELEDAAKKPDTGPLVAAQPEAKVP